MSVAIKCPLCNDARARIVGFEIHCPSHPDKTLKISKELKK